VSPPPQKRIFGVARLTPIGRTCPGLSGRAAALPLLFDVFDRLRSGGADRQADNPAVRVAPAGLIQVRDPEGGAPQVLFPPDGSVLTRETAGDGAPGFVLSGLGRDLHWFVAGAPVATDPLTHQAIWRPTGPGFFVIESVDAEGRRSRSNVRVAD
jgi:penicillin-binding protein 1C